MADEGIANINGKVKFPFLLLLKIRRKGKMNV